MRLIEHRCAAREVHRVQGDVFRFQTLTQGRIGRDVVSLQQQHASHSGQLPLAALQAAQPTPRPAHARLHISAHRGRHFRLIVDGLSA
ncbi:MAG: hypothetical protein KGJ64_01390 [Betaproteobacteria bacterium]|nr:hypothetical protein [Betaproteobacteria bacterium]